MPRAVLYVGGVLAVALLAFRPAPAPVAAPEPAPAVAPPPAAEPPDLVALLAADADDEAVEPPDLVALLDDLDDEPVEREPVPFSDKPVLEMQLPRPDDLAAFGHCYRGAWEMYPDWIDWGERTVVLESCRANQERRERRERR